jgi:hypothetical protein
MLKSIGTAHIEAKKSLSKSNFSKKETNDMQKELSTRPMWIVPKLTMRGTQLAGWTPKKLSQKVAKGILFDEDVEITLPDGICERRRAHGRRPDHR